MSTAAAAQPVTPRTNRATPPSSAGNRSSTSARPGSSRVKSAGKSRDGVAKRSNVVEDAGISTWDQDLMLKSLDSKDATPVGPPLTWSFISQDDMSELVNLESLEAIVRKFAQLLGLEDTHHTDLSAGIAVMYSVGNYIFAKESGFTSSETATFCAIMKGMLDREAANTMLGLEKGVAAFRDSLLSHAAPAGAPGDGGISGWEVFRPENVYKITDFVVLTPRKSNSGANRLLRHSLATGAWPPPLSQHLPLAVYEAQKAEEVRKEHERVEQEMELRELERKAAENPFEVLDNEMVKAVATEAVAGLLASVSRDVEIKLEDIRVKFLEKVGGVK
ncbi:hypothetical protein HKX48_004102 [Thoreauomyces humboldtii]|nr:hypothetical protein HKX48_004102 [Thoreauomyces humboldtii]